MLPSIKINKRVASGVILPSYAHAQNSTYHHQTNRFRTKQQPYNRQIQVHKRHHPITACHGGRTPNPISEAVNAANREPAQRFDPLTRERWVRVQVCPYVALRAYCMCLCACVFPRSFSNFYHEMPKQTEMTC